MAVMPKSVCVVGHISRSMVCSFARLGGALDHTATQRPSRTSIRATPIPESMERKANATRLARWRHSS